MIELAGVWKAQGGKPVLRNFSLKVDPGGRVVLFGASGSGKTTILRLIAGFIAPDQGSISLDGALASRNHEILLPPESRGLGYVFQDLALWPHMTVFENVEFALKVRGVPHQERRDRAGQMLALVELDSLRARYPAKLSGGEQQRVAIARALIAQPRAVLMDEPLSNLDNGLRASLCNRILDLQSRLGFALVYVTHDRDEIRMLEGRVVLLEGTKTEPAS